MVFFYCCFLKLRPHQTQKFEHWNDNWGPFQKASSVKSLREVIRTRDRQLTPAWLQEREGNLSCESVTMATETVNPIWLGAGYLQSFSQPPPSFRAKNVVSFPWSFSADLTEACCFHDLIISLIQKKPFFLANEIYFCSMTQNKIHVYTVTHCTVIFVLHNLLHICITLSICTSHNISNRGQALTYMFGSFVSTSTISEWAHCLHSHQRHVTVPLQTKALPPPPPWAVKYMWIIDIYFGVLDKTYFM